MFLFKHISFFIIFIIFVFSFFESHKCTELELESWPEDEILSVLCDNMDHPSNGLFSPLTCLNATEQTKLSAVGQYYKAVHSLRSVPLDPVILIPGLGGSGLEAQLHKKEKPAWYCFKSANWFRLWFSLEEFFAKKCWLDNLGIFFDPATRDYKNTDGVEIQPIDFGGVGGVSYLDIEFGHPISATSVFAPVVASFILSGYTPGKNLRGAPFDWRVPANSAYKRGWYLKLQNLIEETYTQNGNRSVHLITHSLGGPTTLYFLNLMSQEWKDRYIKSYIPIAGPWAGAPAALRAVVSGNNFGMTVKGHEIISCLDFREISRQAGGIVELLPNADLWDTHDVLVSTGKRNYTARDYSELFRDAGALTTVDVHADVSMIVRDLKPPMVPTYCIYGHGVRTEVKYTYPNGDFNSEPIVDDHDLGDGTVPLASLQQCKHWAKKQTQPVFIKEYDQLTHVSILKSAEVISHILSITSHKHEEK